MKKINVLGIFVILTTGYYGFGSDGMIELSITDAAIAAIVSQNSYFDGAKWVFTGDLNTPIFQSVAPGLYQSVDDYASGLRRMNLYSQVSGIRASSMHSLLKMKYLIENQAIIDGVAGRIRPQINKS